MRGLEDQLGTRLLHRTTRSVSLTDAGERLLGRLSPLMRDLESALEEAADVQGHTLGTLRINGDEAALRLLLRTVLPEFMTRYPGVALDLVAEGRLVDIVEQGFDAGIRLGSGPQGHDRRASRPGPSFSGGGGSGLSGRPSRAGDPGRAEGPSMHPATPAQR